MYEQEPAPAVADDDRRQSRGLTWTQSEVQLLISKWADENIQNMVNSKIHKTKIVFEKIAASIPERDWDSCYKKVMQLEI